MRENGARSLEDVGQRVGMLLPVIVLTHNLDPAIPEAMECFPFSEVIYKKEVLAREFPEIVLAALERVREGRQSEGEQ